MLDARLRPLIDPMLSALARECEPYVSANQVTVGGFVIGLLAIPLLAQEFYLSALLVILCNRVLDGLDGAIARRSGATDLGGYLDIVLDFIFYSAVIFGFCLAQPEHAVYGAFLIFSFVGTGATFLTFSIFAERHQLSSVRHGSKSIYYLGGLTEGFETILVFVLACLIPEAFWLLAAVFGSMCWITTVSRIVTAVSTLKGL